MKVHLTTAASLAAFCSKPTSAQFIGPSAAVDGVYITKSTSAASEPGKCYNWIFKYLNNVVPGSNNTGEGFATGILPGTDEEGIVMDDSPPNVVQTEANELNTTFGFNFMSEPIIPDKDRIAYEKEGLRMPIKYHQSPCARTGRANIINATTYTAEEHNNFSRFEDEWKDNDWINGLNSADPPAYQNVFGLHSVGCMYHNSGPCKLQDLERSISAQWSKNFSRGYVPFMDNNIMIWTPTLGPLLDMFAEDGVEFYPMRWDDGNGEEAFSVIANPCGLSFYEISSRDTGGRPASQFNSMPHQRAVLEKSGLFIPRPEEGQSLPLVPIRISRAAGDQETMDQMLKFYGADTSDPDWEGIPRGLNFVTEVLLDQTIDSGRAVTMMLSGGATVHLQVWLHEEEQATVEDEPTFPTGQDFKDAAARSNQMNGGQPVSAKSFCETATWTVRQYNSYVKKTHEATMSPPPPKDYAIKKPPAGGPIDSFIDFHFNWQCVAPDCKRSSGIEAFFNAGSRVYAVAELYSVFVYSYDPSGFGVEFQFIHPEDDFELQGDQYPSCFRANESGVCPFSFSTNSSVKDSGELPPSSEAKLLPGITHLIGLLAAVFVGYYYVD